MKKVRHEHVIDAPFDKMMEIYRDDEFYVKKLKNSGAITVEILEREELPGGRLRKKVRATEPSRVPPPFRKNDVDEYIDENVLDPEAGTLTWTITPATMADKIKLRGVVEFHPEGDKTRMVFNTEMEAKIPLVGGKIEQIGLSKSEEEVQTQVDFIRKWVEEH